MTNPVGLWVIEGRPYVPVCLGHAWSMPVVPVALLVGPFHSEKYPSLDDKSHDPLIVCDHTCTLSVAGVWIISTRKGLHVCALTAQRWLRVSTVVQSWGEPDTVSRHVWLRGETVGQGVNLTAVQILPPSQLADL